MTRERTVILIAAVLILICVGGVILAAIAIFGLAWFTTTPTVGPVFSSPQALAYDLVYETTTGVALTDSIQPLLSQADGGTGTYTAVLIGYETETAAQTQLVVAREKDLGRGNVEYFVQNMTPGSSWENDDLEVRTAFYEHESATETAVYGQIHNPQVTAVTILWEDTQTEAQIAYAEDGTPLAFLWFQTRSVTDGSARPAAVTAVGADGTPLSTLP